MSCVSGAPTFRLLDHLVGWDPLDVHGLTNPDDPGGIRLARTGPRGLVRGDLLPWLPDPRLAPGCGRCAWYLATPQRGLLRRDPCTDWRPVWPSDCDPGLARHPHALSARGHLLAAATPEAVYVWRRDGDQLVAVIPGYASAVALAPWGEVLLARDGSTDLDRYDLAGVSRGCITTGMTGRVIALTTGRALAEGQNCTIWALTDTGGIVQLWRGERDNPSVYQHATPDDLAAAVHRTSLSAASDVGFCLVEPGPDGDLQTSCFTWDGQSLEAIYPDLPPLETSGQLLTRTIDSGQPRCRWHRVRIQADIPTGTTVAVAVATTEDPTPLGATAGPRDPDGYPTGPPNPDDWQLAHAGSVDFLVNQPAGRYLYLRLRLTGDGLTTPTVRRIRLDFPRTTSAELLPAVYIQDPAAADFTERFLSLFDAAFDEVDRAIERYPALLDPHGVPDEVLPWLGGLLGLSFDPTWDAATRRALLVAIPSLYRGRGTPAALSQAIKIVFGVDVAIHELAADRNWAALNRPNSRLRSTRLFGRSRARFRVGGSALSSAPLRSFGNPDEDPLTAQANRIRVLLPPAPGRGEPNLAALRRLVERQAPAHTVTEVRPGGQGFVVGVWSAVGVDTALVPLPAPVLGRDTPTGTGRAVTLHRHSVLWPAARGSWMGIRLGVDSAIGIQTVAQ
ncbi:MAG TPA: phage tail protein [Mycobacterium sp.]|nr:phage tail protein [Mycobacterium sp.]